MNNIVALYDRLEIPLNLLGRDELGRAWYDTPDLAIWRQLELVKFLKREFMLIMTSDKVSISVPSVENYDVAECTHKSFAYSLLGAIEAGLHFFTEKQKEELKQILTKR